MLSPLIIRLLQSQGGVSGSGSFGETTCEGRGLCLTLHVAKRARRLKSVETALFPKPKLTAVFCRHE